MAKEYPTRGLQLCRGECNREAMENATIGIGEDLGF